MLASIFNLIFPGSGLIWYRRTVQAGLYGMAFSLLSGLRGEIGLTWAIYVFVMAQIHFSRVKKGTVGFSARGKRILWTVTILLVALYSLSYSSWRSDIFTLTLFRFLSIVACLMLHALLETFWLKPKSARQVFEFFRVWRKLPSQFLDALADKLKSEKNATEFVHLCDKTGTLKNDLARSAINLVRTNVDPEILEFPVGMVAFTLGVYASDLVEQRQWEEAKRAIEMALLLDESSLPAWALMADVSLNLDDFRAASAWADKVLTVKPCEYFKDQYYDPEAWKGVYRQTQAIKDVCRIKLQRSPTLSV